jgi:hypothetical protein
MGDLESPRPGESYSDVIIRVAKSRLSLLQAASSNRLSAVSQSSANVR